MVGESFSALQRAEIAEMFERYADDALGTIVSVLFNEPKLLKSYTVSFNPDDFVSFSALQRAEIAEIIFPNH